MACLGGYSVSIATMVSLASPLRPEAEANSCRLPATEGEHRSDTDIC
jgi:hypothetical protein